MLFHALNPPLEYNEGLSSPHVHEFAGGGVGPVVLIRL